MSEKKASVEKSKSVTVNGVEIPVRAKITETVKGPSIRAFVPADAVDSYYKALKIESEVIDRYESAKTELLEAVRMPMVELFEENPTTIPVTTRIGSTGQKVILHPKRTVKSGVDENATRVPQYGVFKVATKIVAPGFNKTSDSAKELAARVKAAMNE